MKSLFTLLLILLGGLFAAAQDTTLIPRELFFQPKDIHHIKLAADGRRLGVAGWFDIPAPIFDRIRTAVEALLAGTSPELAPTQRRFG